VLSDLRSGVQDFLADLLNVDVADIHPTAELQDELCLDSLQRLDLYTWLATRGVDLDTLPGDGPRTVAEAQEALDAADPASAPPPARTTPSAGPRPHVLRTPQLALRPVHPEYVPFLYDLAIREDVGWRWRFRGAIPDIETFEAGLRQGVLSQFVVVAAPSGMPVGTVGSYQGDLGRGTAHVAAAFVPEQWGSRLPIAAVDLFVRHLFQVWNLRKLYLEVPEFNYAQIASGVGRYFEVEGRLREHSYYDGRYWDEYVLAVYRTNIPGL